MKTLLIMCLLMLSSCSNEGKFGHWDVQERELSDGTHCAILIGYRKGGISCDWQEQTSY